MVNFTILDLINELRLGDYTATELAEKLKTNHMKILRWAKQLIEENVLDSLKRGRNRQYSLKATMEAKNYLFMAELYRLNTLVSRYPSLRRVISAVQNDKRIRLAVMFGSYSDFSASKNSDVDIFVEGNDQKIREDLERKDSRASIKLGSYDGDSLLFKEIWKKHVILKGVEEYYGKTKFFEGAL